VSAASSALVIDRDGLDVLIRALGAGGRTVIGPTVRDGAVVYAEVASCADLPEGWGDQQSPGHYRLRRRADDALFGYAVGPDSWKRYLFPPSALLWQAQVSADTLRLSIPPDPPRYAFLGVRACELAAIGVQDRVLVHTRFPDRDYTARRADLLLVAVSCGSPSGACFCTSMGTGPRAESGYDLALTELIDANGHRFLVEVGSQPGAEIAAQLPTRDSSPEDAGAAAYTWAAASAAVERVLDTADLPALLRRNLDHPRYDDVAARCLSCGNCTMVCPTCFCVDLPEAGGLEAGSGERRRVWTSCFSVDHSRLHGGSVRKTPRARYRQWLTHKLSTWHDQFGTSGCVGCGRCIAWCPAGIDITEEVAAIRATDGLSTSRIEGAS
jgi:ferredoxin